MADSPRILVTEPIVDEVLDFLRRNFHVDVGERCVYHEELPLAEAAENYDALLTMLTNPVTKRVLNSGNRLKVVGNHAVGYDNVDVEAAGKLGIHVANTPGVLTDATADATMALILSCCRPICEAQEYLRAGNFTSWEPVGFLGMELSGKTLGIVGMGRIGQVVARRAKSFGMEIHYHKRNRLDEAVESDLEATYQANVEALAAKSDILSLHCPLTEQTHHLVDASILNALPNHAFLINTSRGPVVDEAALAKALHQGKLGGAGLDVFEKEPEVHPELLTAPRTVLVPHIGSATYKTRRAMGMLAAEAITAILKGKKAQAIPNLVV